ncbi:MAG: hypothetical protein BWY02_02417 [bacterium ADurb.Bin157]|nr:MAG: hypothetical protein BWY02_02417 [bacterium ADurb.Bin157]
MKNIDKFIQNLIQSFLEKEESFLSLALREAEKISFFRQNQHRGTAAYGFEWAIQTSLSYYLAESNQVSELKIGKKSCYQPEAKKYKKYDLCFFVPNLNCKVILELKTIAVGASKAKSYIGIDIKKQFLPDAVVYVLVCSYPSTNHDFPEFPDTEKLVTGSMPENFTYCIYRIKKNR